MRIPDKFRFFPSMVDMVSNFELTNSLNIYPFSAVFDLMRLKQNEMYIKVHIYWEGHKILRNLQQLFVLCTASQIIGGNFAKFCGLLRIYEVYLQYLWDFNAATVAYQNEW